MTYADALKVMIDLDATHSDALLLRAARTILQADAGTPIDRVRAGAVIDALRERLWIVEQGRRH